MKQVEMEEKEIMKMEMEKKKKDILIYYVHLLNNINIINIIQIQIHLQFVLKMLQQEIYHQNHYLVIVIHMLLYHMKIYVINYLFNGELQHQIGKMK